MVKRNSDNEVYDGLDNDDYEYDEYNCLNYADRISDNFLMLMMMMMMMVMLSIVLILLLLVLNTLEDMLILVV